MSTEQKKDPTLVDSMMVEAIRELGKTIVAPQFLRIAKRLIDEEMPEELVQDAASCIRAMSVFIVSDLCEGDDEAFKQGLYAIFMAGFVSGRDGWLFDDGLTDGTLEFADFALQEMRNKMSGKSD
jgi:hypothetical protein